MVSMSEAWQRRNGRRECPFFAQKIEKDTSRRQGCCLISLDQIARKKMEGKNLGGKKRQKQYIKKEFHVHCRTLNLFIENKWIEEEDKAFKDLSCDRTVQKVRIILQKQLIRLL